MKMSFSKALFFLLIWSRCCEGLLLPGQKSAFNFENNGVGEIEDQKRVTLNQTGTVTYVDGTGSCGDSVNLEKGAKLYGMLTSNEHWLMVGSESFSVGLWAMIKSTGNRAVVSFGERGVNALSLSVGFTSSRKLFVFHDPGSIMTSSQKYDLDNWVRILVIYNGTIQKLSVFADSVEVITKTSYFLNFDRLNHLIVGSSTSKSITSGYSSDYSAGEVAVDALSIFGGVLDPGGKLLTGCTHTTLTETISLTETSLTLSLTETVTPTETLRTESATLGTRTETFSSSLSLTHQPTRTNTFTVSQTRQLHITDTPTLSGTLIPPFCIRFLQEDVSDVLAIVTFLVAVASGYSLMFIWYVKLLIASFACEKDPNLPWVFNIASLRVSGSVYNLHIGSVLLNTGIFCLTCVGMVLFQHLLLQLGIDVRVRRLVRMPSDFVLLFFIFVPLVVYPSCFLITNGPIELKLLGCCGVAIGIAIPMWIKSQISETGLKWCSYAAAIPKRGKVLSAIMGSGEWVSATPNHAENVHRFASLVKNSTAMGRKVISFEFYTTIILSICVSYRPDEMTDCAYPRLVGGSLFLLSAAWYAFSRPFCRPIDNVLTVTLSVILSIGMILSGVGFLRDNALEGEYTVPESIFLVAVGVLGIKISAESICLVYRRISSTFEKSQENEWEVTRDGQLETPPPTSLYTALPDHGDDDDDDDEPNESAMNGESPDTQVNRLVKNTSIFEPISTRSCSTTQLQAPKIFTNSPAFPERERMGSTILRTPGFVANKNPLSASVYVGSDPSTDPPAIKKSHSSMTLSSKGKVSGNLLGRSSQTLLFTPVRDDFLGSSSGIPLHDSQYEYFPMDL
eukprot:TRINITY_DN3128_c1_g1_i1.p1 TRINITY_DN3128_c1_g1~~TRINITY_DN3128_c1_g1_i1.p1  ORF type:complete len:848 (+),score=116.34 TRINITY_DN3128_c1_g1_i1:121-2664(+)